MPESDEELFHRLLALDHSRQPPWGPLHGVAVACYLLQQADAPVAEDDYNLETLRVFLAGGQPALTALAEQRTRRNSHRAGSNSPFPPSSGQLLRGPPPSFATTITDVALNGTFPAPGYEQRVRQWAAHTLQAWTAQTR